MTPIRLKLLGGFEARLPDGRLAAVGARKSEALLAYLACRSREVHSRDHLATLLWGDGSDRAARQSLRQALASLRQIFGSDSTLLRTDRETVALHFQAVEIDVVAFEVLARAENASTLAAAAQLYRGPLLEGFALRDEPFDDWVMHERARLHAGALQLLLRLSAITHEDAIAESALQRVLELDSSCEEAHRRLMRRHIDCGRHNAALRQYKVCVDALQRELDATPEPQTIALYREALTTRVEDTPPDAQASTAAPTGERKYVTVLCAAFLSASPDAGLGDPEQTQEALRPALDELRAIAMQRGGAIVSEAGDELVAIFGAPVARENHAANACRAASDMAAAIALRPHFAFRPCVALDSGEAVVRIRDRALLPSGVFGDCLRRATRLSRSGAMQVGVTEATVSLAHRFWRFASIAAVPLEPDGPSIPLYAPIGAWPGSSGLDHFPAQLLSRFVGRQEELAALTAALAAAAAGRGQLIAVVGEPGIGKSRLFHEFVRSVPEAWSVVACRGDPQLADAPYLPIAKAIRACLSIAADEACEPSAADLRRALRALDPGLESSFSAIASLLQLDVSDAAWEALEPVQKRHQIVGAATAVVVQSASRRPLLLVVEDLHWLDPASRTVLERIIEVLPASRMLLAINYRPEFVHAWGGRSFYRQINVGPLSTATTAELVATLLGNDLSVESMRDRLIMRTAGNPFFIEECVRSLAHSGAMVGERGAFRGARELASLALPETVQAVIAARIDQLLPGDKTLLQVAAVIGNEVSYPLLHALAEIDDDDLLAALSRLQASEFLIESSVGSNPSYRFKHALTNEVAYATLLQQARRELHARILSALEAQHGTRLDEHLEALAYHSSRGDIFEKAAEYGRLAGLKAVARAANRAAVAHFGQALSALARLPETSARMVEEIDLRFEMRNALFVLGEHHLVMDHLRRAEALAERANDAFRRGYAELQIGGWFWQQGQQQSCRDATERALAIAREIDDRELTALAWYRLGLSRHAMGAYRSAIEALLRCVSLLEDAGRTDLVGFGGHPYAFCCSFLCWSYAELGAFAEAHEWGARGWRFATQCNHTYTQSVMTFGLGLCHVRERRFDEARTVLERGLDLYRVGEVPVSFSWVASPLGFTYVAAGRVERGLELLHRALTVDQPHLLRAQLELWLADACLLMERSADAREAADRGRLLAEEHGERAHVAWAERILGDVASASDPRAAELHYARAIAIARPLELHAALTTALRGRARLLKVEGRAVDVKELEKKAVTSPPAG